MKSIINLFIFLLLFSASCFSQSSPSGLRFLRSVSSAKANYIYLYGNAADTLLMAATSHFIVERMPYDSASGKPVENKIQAREKAAPVASVKALNDIMPANYRNEFRAAFKLTSDEQLVSYFSQYRVSTDYSLYYAAPETKRAIGHLLVDEEAKSGELVYYRVTRVDNSGQQQPWGYTVLKSKSGMPGLAQLHPAVSSYAVDDSSIAIKWSIPLKGEAASNIAAYLNRYNNSGNAYKVADYLKETGGKLQVMNLDKKEGEKLMPALNEKGDTLTYTYFKKCVPEEEITAYLVTEDEIGNTGGASDTAVAYAVSNRTIPIIRRVAVADTVNGIRLRWAALPVKSYITGVLVLRTGTTDKADTVAILPPTDTAYMDYGVAVGVSYRYQVKGLYLPHLGLAQAIPAQGIGSFTVFSRPLPPFNVKITSEDRNIRLTWEGVSEPGLYGYYVYRGTSPQDLSLIAGPVEQKTFLDTAGSLSGRSRYFYSIVSQNLRQDTSDRSEVVSIMPNRKIETTHPANVSFYYANGTLRVGWDDVREHDNAITGFVVQKKKKSQAAYASLTSKPLETAYLEDSLLERGEPYQYRVAAVSLRGDTTQYSDASEFTVDKMPVATVSLFYVRNISGGIELSLPEVEYEGRKAYNIYRRPATDLAFTKLTTMAANTFLFLDKEAKHGVVYVYSLSVTEADDREGERGESKSIRRVQN